MLEAALEEGVQIHEPGQSGRLFRAVQIEDSTKSAPITGRTFSERGISMNQYCVYLLLKMMRCTRTDLPQWLATGVSQYKAYKKRKVLNEYGHTRESDKNTVI
ncbi:MAG: hypothetical protein V8S84_14615 [Lachnospiraceae bacterium]